MISAAGMASPPGFPDSTPSARQYKAGVIGNMETRQVRYFLAICAELNFTRAAKKCGIAQPSLTTAIQRMEREIGGTLFLRSTRAPRVQLTTLGLQLFLICVQIDNLMEKARSLVS